MHRDRDDTSSKYRARDIHRDRARDDLGENQMELEEGVMEVGVEDQGLDFDSQEGI
jgi:hypothetical protein